MASRPGIVGGERLKAKLLFYGKAKRRRIADAVEATAVIVSNHAKANHIKDKAHFAERYENQTNVLTSSITPRLTVETEDEITAEVFTRVEYAGFVETRFPYLFPALHESRDEFVHRVREAMR